MNHVKIEELVCKHIAKIKRIYPYETNSSHSKFAIIVCCEDKKYICKEVFDKTLSGTDKCVLYEYRALKIACKLGIAPVPIIYDESCNIIVSEFIDDVASPDISMQGVLNRAKYAKILASATYKEQDFIVKHQEFALDYLNHKKLLLKALEFDSKYKEEIFMFLDELNEVCSLSLLMDRDLNALHPVLSHNDLVSENLLRTQNDQYYMIDFETVGISKYDFIIGQLAVDAEIDWNLASTSSESLQALYEQLNSVFDGVVTYRLFLARIMERYVQNICYGYRQLSVGHAYNYTIAYLLQKERIISFCKSRLAFVKEIFVYESRV